MEEQYKKELEEDYVEFKQMLGKFIKREREALGYSSGESFGNKIDAGKSQISEYESGVRGMTLKSFHKIIRGLNKTNEDIFKEAITNEEIEPLSSEFKLSFDQESQVKRQVKESLGLEISEGLTVEDINRLYLILTFCHNKKLKKSEIVSKLKLKKSSNNLNKNLKLVQSAEWLSKVYPDSGTHKEQRYFTTEKGKNVLRLGKSQDSLTEEFTETEDGEEK